MVFEFCPVCGVKGLFMFREGVYYCVKCGVEVEIKFATLEEEKYE